jgi:DNA-binding beta-propeller fold protein YncE
MRCFLSRAASLTASFLCTIAQATEEKLQLKETIPLTGIEGRLDHFAFDAVEQRLFVCALGNNTVEVIDTTRGVRVHSITGLSAPQGVACVAEANRIFVADEEGGILKIFDGKSFHPLGELDFKDDADNIRYDHSTKEILVGFGSGGLAIVNALTGKQLGAIKLTAHPEAFILEQNGKRIFINVPNAHHVAVVDRDRPEVLTNWKTEAASGNFPIALDETNHRLFVGYRIPPKLIVLNADSGQPVTSIAISEDSDDIWYDSKRHRIYAICGAGKIDVIDQMNANNYRILTKIDTALGARTGLFVPEEDTLFVAVPHHGSQRAEIRVYQIK